MKSLFNEWLWRSGEAKSGSRVTSTLRSTPLNKEAMFCSSQYFLHLLPFLLQNISACLTKELVLISATLVGLKSGRSWLKISSSEGLQVCDQEKTEISGLISQLYALPMFTSILGLAEQ